MPQAADAAAELRLRETVWRQRENTLCAHVAQLQSSLAQSKGGLAPSFSNKSLGRLSGTSSAGGAAQEADEVQIVPTTSLVLNNQGRLISEGG